MCLAAGLAGHPPSAGFPTDSVARRYAWWCCCSAPFDIGATCEAAFHLPGYEAAGADVASQMQARASCPASLASQANGATMRAAPLAIWAHRLAPGAIVAAAATVARLSHASLPCQDANAAYVLALAELIRRPGDAAAAIAVAEGWAAAYACSEVQQWLAAARDDAAMAGYRADRQIGWVRHGLQLTFHHLHMGSGYEQGLRHTLLAGGDTGEGGDACPPWAAEPRRQQRGQRMVQPRNRAAQLASPSSPKPLPPCADTNAAIVGGMLGALHGVEGIPAAMRAAVQLSGSTADSRERPDQLHGQRLEPVALQLYTEAVRDAEATSV